VQSPAIRGSRTLTGSTASNSQLTVTASGFKVTGSGYSTAVQSKSVFTGRSPFVTVKISIYFSNPWVPFFGRHISMNVKRLRISFLLVVLLVLFSYYFLDTSTALFVKRVWTSHARLAVFSANIPDFLFSIVCLITGIAWTAYFYLTHKGIYDTHTRFFQLVAITIPLTFFLKSALKHVVGRIDTRFWLRHPGFKEFHWFHGGGHYTSFPSGHMAVFMALVIALRMFYPRYQSAYFGFLSVLALALIMTDYHFISDVIAGAYLGFLVNYFTNLSLTFFSNRRMRTGGWDQENKTRQ
jgi:membrane-associated phospholipid phosphatase